jgi:WD40 repeat protein
MSNTARQFALSRDGRAALETETGVELWRLKTKRKQLVLEASDNGFLPLKRDALAFSHDNRVVVLGSNNGGVRVCSAADGKLLTDFKIGSFNRLALSPDGTVVATIAKDKIDVWDARSGAQIQTLTGAKDTLNCLAFSPDGTLIAAGGFDNSVGIWKWRTAGTPHEVLIDRPRTVWSLAFSNDGRTLYVMHAGRELRIWDVETWQYRFKFELQSSANKLTISGDGRYLAVGRTTGPVKIFVAASSEEVEAAGVWWDD